MFLSCHVRVSEWIHTLYLPECQGTPCSKQARKLKFKLSDSTGLKPRSIYFVNEHLAIWSNWPNGWVFVYEVNGSGFESSCTHLKAFLPVKLSIIDNKSHKFLFKVIINIK